MTLDDIVRAEKTHRKDVSCVEGKMTRRNPTTTAIMNVTMPKELKEHNENIALCIDIVCVNEIGFAMSTLHSLHC